MKIKANGIAFNCAVDGRENAPWLVFSNSLATNLSMWEPQLAEFQRDFRILRYDQRGHGQTEAPAGRYAFDTLIADVVALLDAVGATRAHFVGLSLGGATGLGLVQQFPDRVDRLVVCDSPCMSTPQSAAQWEARIANVEKDGMTAELEATIARWFPPEIVAADPPYIAKVREMIHTTPANGFIGCCAALADHDYNSKVETVKRPALFLVGEKDGANPAAMRKMHERLKGSQYVELAGAGHISNLDRSAQFNRAVREFLAD